MERSEDTSRRCYGCFYTRTTGIWQTVWLEKVPKNHITSMKIYPDVENTSVLISAMVVGSGTLKVKASYDGKPMGEESVKTSGGLADLILPLNCFTAVLVDGSMTPDEAIEFLKNQATVIFP